MMQRCPPDVLAHWSSLRDCPSERFGTGLINDTFRVEGRAGDVIVQQLHKAFGPAVMDDIEAITAHLAAKGVTTPKLVPTDAGALWVTAEGDLGSCWRALTFVPGGRSFDKVTGPAMAEEAGALVGAWHTSLLDLRHRYQHVRQGVHDTERHLGRLSESLANPANATFFVEVSALSGELFAAKATLPDLQGDPLRNCHGDLKLSNLLFDAEGKGLCLVDLDTLSEMRLAHELGDALRSWCNRAGEDQTEAALDLAVFESAVRGYARTAGAWVTEDERDHLVDGLRTICLELTARFLDDTLRDAYFGWDAARYASRAEHNWVRARGQWSLYKAATREAEAMRAVVRGLWR